MKISDNNIQATLVISTPDNSILPLISKWNESPNFFSLYGYCISTGYLKVWITWNYGYLKVDFHSQTKLCMFIIYLKV